MKDFQLTLTTNAEFNRQKQILLSENPNKKFYVNITEKPKKRSIPANSAYYAWLPKIADFIAMTIPETRCLIKLDFGLPIVLADEQIGQRYGTRLQEMGFFNWSREMQINHMEFIQVTSLMDNKQHKRMRDDIQNHFGLMGLDLNYENN